MIRIGIIREGKNPPDKRVPLSPKQCKALKEQYPTLEITVQPSNIRAFTDDEYKACGIALSEDMTACDILFGVKEVPIEMLIPNKTYLFFSHTYKKQSYNRNLLQAILQKNIRLIDYEMLKDGNKRLLGFGRYAGIVGTYNAFRAWGEMTGNYRLKPAHQCEDRKELERELIGVQLSKGFKIAITGAGRVAAGAMEILSALRITQVFPDEYVQKTQKDAVFTQLDVRHYFERKDGNPFTRSEFYKNPEGFQSSFMKYAAHTDIYIPSHFWSNLSPYIFTREDAKSSQFKIQLVSDISCDINGPVASTLRPSTIEKPFYAYNPFTEKEEALGTPNTIGVSAVDNLPCELPRDASEDFGNEMVKNIIPHFFNGDKHHILANASETTLEGKLTPQFEYLTTYVEGKE